MTKKPEPNMDWSVATWKGSRQQQHREFHALPFSRKLELIEQMAEFASQLGNAQETIQPSSAVRETPAPYPSQDQPQPESTPQPDKPVK
jgi:hypothetical protein